MCFKDTVFKQFIADNPDKNHKEVMGIVGAAWKKMTDPEKEKYVKMSKDDIAARAAAATDAPKTQGSSQAHGKVDAKKPTPAKPQAKPTPENKNAKKAGRPPATGFTDKKKEDE